MNRVPYLASTTGIYLNFFILGMVNIIFGSNMDSLTGQLGTTAGGVSTLLSGFGVGKLLTYAINGYLSDKIGRKPVIIIASVLMAFFLFTFPFTSSYVVAFILAIIMGIGNSALDSGSYPALTESYPNSAGTANVLSKVFNSIGGILLPLFITFLLTNDMSYKMSFIIPGIVTVVALIILIFAKFPSNNSVGSSSETTQQSKFIEEPKFWIEGAALVVIGFTSLALIMIAPLWIPTLAQSVLGMSQAASVSVISYYTAGAFVSVILLTLLLKKISVLYIMIVYPVLTIVGYVLVLLLPVSFFSNILIFIVGLSISGVLQLAITAITTIFWQRKGAMTGIISTSGSIAVIIMPALTGYMEGSIGIQSVIWLEVILSVIGLIAAVVVFYRYKAITGGRVDI